MYLITLTLPSVSQALCGPFAPFAWYDNEYYIHSRCDKMEVHKGGDLARGHITIN